MYKALHKIYYRDDPIDRYLVQTQSQTKVAGVKLSEVHGIRKTILIHSPIEKHKPQIQERQVDNNRPTLGRGRAGLWHKHCNLLLTLRYQLINPQTYQPLKKLL